MMMFKEIATSFKTMADKIPDFSINMGSDLLKANSDLNQPVFQNGLTTRNQPLERGRDTENIEASDGHSKSSDSNVERVNVDKIEQIEKNRLDGENREETAFDDIQKEFPESEGFTVEREQYLRDIDGKICKDPLTDEARRVDFVVSKDGQVVKSIEVTSQTAPKDLQIAKEDRIREAGGNYIKDRNTGELIEIPKDIRTEVRRYA